MSSRLFIKVRERNGLAYSIHTSVDNATDTGYLVTQAGIDHKNLEKAIKLILQEYKDLKDKKITETPTEGVADTQVVTTTAELKEAVGEVMQAKVDELGEQLGEQLQATVKEQFATVEERVEELREELREGLKEGLQAAQATGTPNEAEPAPTAPEPALTPAATSENLPEPIKEAIVTAVESKAAVTAEETKVQVAEEIHKQLEEIQSAAAQPETPATSNNHVTHKLIDVNKDQVKRSHSTLVGIIVVETLIIIGLGVYSAFLQEKNNSLKAAPVPGSDFCAWAMASARFSSARRSGASSAARFSSSCLVSAW